MPRLLLWSLLILTVVRFVIAGSNELSEDEAYYHLWSERLAPSYYSKGPGVATTMAASTAVFGKSEFGVRFFAPLLALGSSLVLFRLARSVFDDRVAAWSVMLLNLVPIFNAGGVILTIDPLSIFFWLLAMLTFWRALHRASAMHWLWPVTGLVIGLGFLCKYTNALQLLSILVLLVFSRRWRGQLRRPGWLLMLGGFAVCTIPVLIWNAQNGWITFVHLWERGKLDGGGSGFDLGEFFEFLGGHFGVYSPFIFMGLLWALVVSTRQFFKDERQAFLVSFALPIVALYFLLSFNEAGELNWTAPGWLPVAVLLAFHWPQLGVSPKWKSKLMAMGLVFAGAMSLLALNTDNLRKTGVRWSYGKDIWEPSLTAGEVMKSPYLLLDNASDFSGRLRGWKSTAEKVGEIVKESSSHVEEKFFLIANRYQTAAIIAHYLPEDVEVIRPTTRHPVIHIVESQAAQNQFSFWPTYGEITERVEVPQ
ncbi:MAG: glycosyltransferase family 39 protein, partial [Verrucomicrobiota bacterium]